MNRINGTASRNCFFQHCLHASDAMAMVTAQHHIKSAREARKGQMTDEELARLAARAGRKKEKRVEKALEKRKQVCATLRALAWRGDRAGQRLVQCSGQPPLTRSKRNEAQRE
jgi:hypothetical protein